MYVRAAGGLVAIQGNAAHWHVWVRMLKHETKSHRVCACVCVCLQSKKRQRDDDEEGAGRGAKVRQEARSFRRRVAGLHGASAPKVHWRLGGPSHTSSSALERAARWEC